LVVFGITGIAILLMKSGIKLNIPENFLLFLEEYSVVLIPIVAILISYQFSKHIY